METPFEELTGISNTPTLEVFDTIKIANCLSKGGIVLLPTDTVYGLAVSPKHPDSVERLYQIKNRKRDVFFPIMIHHPCELEAMGVAVNQNARKLLDSPFVPGALTLVLGFKHTPILPWQQGRTEIGIRIPKHEPLLAVLKKTGPLLVSSANRHTFNVPDKPGKILSQLSGKLDLIIDVGSLKTTASTVVNCRHILPVIEREGVVSKKKLNAILGGHLP